MTLNIFIINTKSQVNQMDSKCCIELGVKLLCHSKEPIQNTLEYNCYVVNDSLFHTLAHYEGKKTQNSGIYVPTIDGDTYYGKLTRIIEIEYYDTARYVLFKCDWADIRRDRATRRTSMGSYL